MERPQHQLASHGAADDSLSGSESNLRDKMLKDPGSEADPSHKYKVFVDMIPAVPQWSRQPNAKLDSDLDETVKQADDLNKLFEPTQRRHGGTPGPLVPKHDFQNSMFNSVSISTIHRPDGSTEQRRTTRDSSGNDETTVTRSVGDKVHTKTTRTSPSGEQSHKETYNTKDDGQNQLQIDMGWKDKLSSEQPSLPSTQQKETQLNESIFRKFFGFSLPSTSRKDF